MNGDVTISSATLDDDGETLHLRIVVHNSGDRTCFVYGSSRAVKYEADNKTLTIQMSDHGLREPRELRGDSGITSTTFIQPQIEELPPHSDKELALRVPRTTVHVDPTQVDGAVLRLQTDALHEAEVVNIKLRVGRRALLRRSTPSLRTTNAAH